MSHTHTGWALQTLLLPYRHSGATETEHYNLYEGRTRCRAVVLDCMLPRCTWLTCHWAGFKQQKYQKEIAPHKLVGNIVDPRTIFSMLLPCDFVAVPKYNSLMSRVWKLLAPNGLVLHLVFCVSCQITKKNSRRCQQLYQSCVDAVPVHSVNAFSFHPSIHPLPDPTSAASVRETGHTVDHLACLSLNRGRKPDSLKGTMATFNKSFH